MSNKPEIDDVNRDLISAAPCAQPENKGHGTIVAGPEARAAAGAQKAPSITSTAGGPTVPGVGQANAQRLEHAYWRANFSESDYVEQGSSFDDYGPAYDFGVNARGRYPGRNFDDVESEMACDWVAGRGVSSLSWTNARFAARDAWDRISPPQGSCA